MSVFKRPSHKYADIVNENATELHGGPAKFLW